MTQRGASPLGERGDLIARLGLPPDASDEDVRDAVASGLGSAKPAAPRAPSGGRGRRNHPLLLVAVALLGVAVVIGVGMIGRDPAPSAQALPSGHPSVAASATAQATPAVDEAAVAALKQKLDADPDDAATLYELGNLYSLAGDAASATLWHGKAVSVRPDDTDTLLAYGVDLFNLGDLAGAITQWTRVTELRPTDADAWYNLGWAYLQSDPPDAAKADEAWGRVVELAPDSDLADTVRNHLPGAGKASPSPTPTK